MALQKLKKIASILLPLYLIIGALIAFIDIASPLPSSFDALHIDSRPITFAIFALPLLSMMLWFLMARKKRNGVGFCLALLLLALGAAGLMGLYENKIDRVSTTRLMSGEERKLVEHAMGSTVQQMFTSGMGYHVIYPRSPLYREKLIEQLKTIGIYRPV